MDRGRGDGQECEGGPAAAAGAGAGQPAAGGNVPAAAVAAAAAGGVDLNAPHVKEIVDSIVAMGISRPVAEMAVMQTGADTAEGAIAWVFENEMGGGSAAESSEMYEFQEYKMVFVVNASLPMTPGKIAAQVGHAAIGIYQNLISKQDVHGASLLQWEDNGSKKIVVQCETTEQLHDLASQAEKLGLPYSQIEDAGHTQIAAGSHTVLAVFGLATEVDKVTGKLKLFP